MFKYKDLPLPIITKLEEIRSEYNVSDLEIVMASINLMHKIFSHKELDRIEGKLDRLLEKILNTPHIESDHDVTIFDQLVRIDNKIGLILDKIGN